MPSDSEHSDKFPPLQGIEDYPRWAQHAEAELQTKDCHDAIASNLPPINKDAAIAFLRDVGYADREVTHVMTFGWIEKHMAKRQERETKAVGILKKLQSRTKISISSKARQHPKAGKL
ncbi:hypothetical protein MMC07_006303 [Pseudocyphellaria aurata]|nr:hypothetical protein [Pseudocyphellaria aurata]